VVLGRPEHATVPESAVVGGNGVGVAAACDGVALGKGEKWAMGLSLVQDIRRMPAINKTTPRFRFTSIT
jgi:hypothetical protein